MKISVLIPVYRDAKRAGDLADKLLRNNYADSEIVIVIDGPVTPSISDLLQEFEGRVRFIRHEENLGKVGALNTAVAELSTDALLFFDNDILLPEDENFLDRLAAEFKEHDIIEIPKEAIVRSFVSAMMRYEFLNMAIGNFIFARFSRRCPYMNGAAFAIRKNLFDELGGFSPVVHEDADIAARSFARSARYSYNPRLMVLNEVPVTVSDWVIQRKRWALNVVLWIRDNLAVFLQNFIRDRNIRRSSLFLLIPFLVYPLMLGLFGFFRLPFVTPYVLDLGNHSSVVAALLQIHPHINPVLFGMIPAGLALCITLVFYLALATRLGFKFNPVEFLLFYFLYSPIMFFFCVYFGILVILKIDIRLDWTITDKTRPAEKATAVD